jgi:hypothetical protein
MVTNLNKENKDVSEYGARTLNKLQKPETEAPIFKFNTSGTTFGPEENLLNHLTPYEKKVFLGAIFSHWSQRATDIFFLLMDTPFEGLVWMTNVPALANHYCKTRILVWSVVGLNSVLLVLTHSTDYLFYLQYG